MEARAMLGSGVELSDTVGGWYERDRTVDGHFMMGLLGVEAAFVRRACSDRQEQGNARVRYMYKAYFDVTLSTPAIPSQCE